MKACIKNLCLSTTAAISMISLTAFAVPFASSPEHKASIERAEKDYVAARKLCDVLKGNPQDVCIAEAKAERKKQEADADAAEENTAAAKTKALITYADADFEVAKAKCDAEDGNAKDICIKRAKVQHQQSVSIAEANQKVRDAHEEALDKISDADYDLELEKCEQLSGEPKKDCISKVKANFSR